MARKRGQITERSPGKHLVRAFVGRNEETGKKEYASKVIEGSYKDAEKALTALLHEIDEGSYVGSSTETLEGYATQYIAGKELEPRTRKEYQQRLALDIFPKFGKARLQKLTRVDLQAHFQDLKARLSARTRQYTYMILKQVLEQARRDGLIKANPMQDVQRPQVRKHDRVLKVQPLTEEEAERLLQNSEGHRLHPLWLFLLTTGARPSEALALEWRNVHLGTEVDVTTPFVLIEASLSEDEEGELQIRGTKNQGSERRVTLPRRTVRALETHRAAQLRHQLKAGVRTDLVFPNMAGKPADLHRIRQRWKTACKRAGVPQVRLYDARHTHATWLLDHGVNPKVAAERLGHSSTQMFLDVYTHVTKKAEDQALQILDTAWG